MIWLLLAIAVCLFIIGKVFCDKVMYPKTMSYEETYAIETSSGNMQFQAFEAMEKEEVLVKSPYGYDLYSLFLPCPGSKKAVLIVHGITVSWHASVKYMDMFRRRGYNIFLYDHRNHGKSGGTDTTLGFYEKNDLKGCVDWVFDRLGPDAVVGMHGESMGAATILQYAELDDRIAFYVADCPFSRLDLQLAHLLKRDYKLPAFLVVPFADMIFQLRTGIHFFKVSPIDSITKVKTPVFFIHGQKDTYIPPSMSEAMYAAKPSRKKLYLAPDARHAGSYGSNPEEYERQVAEFLDEIGY